MLTPIVILVRREKWFLTFLDILKKKIKNVIESRKRFRYTLVVLLLTITATLLTVTKWTSYFFMKEYSNRYIFVLYPLTVVLAVSTVYFIISFIFENEKIPVIALLVISIVLSTVTHFMPDSKAYLFEHEEEGKTFKDLDQNARCIIVLWSDWIITCFAPDLYNTDAYFATNYFNFKVPFDYYLIVDQHYILPDDLTYEEARQYPFYDAAGENLYSEEDFLKFYTDLDIVDRVEYVGKDEEYGRKFKIYKVYFRE